MPAGTSDSSSTTTLGKSSVTYSSGGAGECVQMYLQKLPTLIIRPIYCILSVRFVTVNYEIQGYNNLLRFN